MLKAIRERLLAINPGEASFEARGFEPCDPAVRSALEAIIRAFISGYNLTLRTEDHAQLAAALEQQFDRHHVGFAFEGAGMCLALLDLIGLSGPHRLTAFLSGAGAHQDYIAAVGAGFPFARLGRSAAGLDRYMASLDPLLAWCLPDGYGFHQGFFHHREFIDAAAEYPSRLPRHARQLFDSGVGRSMWWVKGADPLRIRQSIDRFPEDRRAEMWCGLGVAAAYAGALPVDGLLKLYELAESHQSDFLSGVPFAARLRQKGGNPSIVTDLACGLFFERPVDEIANLIVDEAAAIGNPGQPAASTAVYAALRQRLVHHPLISRGRRVEQ